jgi:Nif-specific regulatory protein
MRLPEAYMGGNDKRCGILDEACRCNELESQLAALFEVSTVLNRSLNLSQTLREVLEVLHRHERLCKGMVSLVDPESGDLAVNALREDLVTPVLSVRYLPGEGIVGRILERNQPWVVPRVADEPHFLDRLGVYDRNLPFIGVPIRIGEEGAVGVFAGQPPSTQDQIDQRVRFLEMVANLIGQAVRLAHRVEDEQRELKEERDTLRRQVRGDYGFDSVIGHTDAMKLVFEQVRQVAKWNTTVLVRGESGTGKELVANAIHYNSPRARNAFIKVNCAALPDNLLESELFGHEKGAFTGASAQRKGRFEQADGGTLFLDEIGDISRAFQAKLLRVLQEGEFERVGGNRTLSVDVRIIAATNRDLEAEVKAGTFREDLYYRLNVMPIRMPSLSERIEDVPDLARFLVIKIGKVQGRELRITDSALRVLMRHDWPGNVRELENCLERAAVMSEQGVIDRDIIQLAGLDVGAAGRELPMPVSEARTVDLDDPSLDERERIIAALEEAGWVQAKAARLLNMTPRQIAYRIQTLNIRVRQF